MKIAMLDPGNFTPLYNANLCHCLGSRGNQVELSTSEFLFESVPPLTGYRIENDFFHHVGRWKAIKKRPIARQALKAAAYPIDMVRWSSRTASARPDVVHVQWSLAPLLDIRMYGRLRRASSRVVYTAHDVHPLPGSTWSGAGFSRLYNWVDVVVVHAEEARRLLVEEHGVDSKRVHVLPMGGPGAYARKPPPQDEARRLLDLRPDVPYLLFFGMIKEHKGLDLLLDALALGLRDRPDLRLLVAGEPMGSWNLYADRIARLGLGGSVDLRLGFVPSEEAPTYFGAADVVVLPYREIFQSGVVLAAYSFERPVVATRVGGIPELVEEGVTGFLAPPADARALAEVLVRATADLARLADLGTSAARVARDRHSWDRIAARHEEIYREALTPDRGQRLPSRA